MTTLTIKQSVDRPLGDLICSLVFGHSAQYLLLLYLLSTIYIQKYRYLGVLFLHVGLGVANHTENNLN